jgi:hypothetical protein
MPAALRKFFILFERISLHFIKRISFDLGIRFCRRIFLFGLLCRLEHILFGAKRRLLDHVLELAAIVAACGSEKEADKKCSRDHGCGIGMVEEVAVAVAVPAVEWSALLRFWAAPEAAV